MSSGATLSGLPAEVLVLILGHFCRHCREPEEIPNRYAPRSDYGLNRPPWNSLDVQTLYSSCLVSRRLCQVAQPILYHELIPAYWESGQVSNFSWQNRLSSFLRTVALRRDLAASVRRFSLSPFFQTVYLADEARVVLEEVARARNISLPDFLRPFKDTWARERASDDQYRPGADELAAMLLPCLPNLVRLDLASYSHFNPIYASALRVAAGVSSLSLETIDIYGSHLTPRLDGILEMCASTLRTLNIDSYVSEVTGGNRMLAYPMPNLQNLCITRCDFNGEDLERLLSYCLGLKTFVYDARKSVISLAAALCFEVRPLALITVDIASSPEPHLVLPSDFISFLSKHQETLVTLHLRLWTPYASNESLFPEPRLTSFRDFPVLRHVLFDLAFVYPDDIDEAPEDPSVLVELLPLSIVSLRLQAVDTAEVRARLEIDLLCLAEAASQGQFPSLKMVKCCYQEEGFIEGFLDDGLGDGLEDGLDDGGLSEMFASAGVDFGYEPKFEIWRVTS